MPASEREEDGDIVLDPGLIDRVEGTKADAIDQAPESAGRPGKVSPQSVGRNTHRQWDLDRAHHEPGRGIDAASPARPAAKGETLKDLHPRIRALARRYNWLVQRG